MVHRKLFADAADVHETLANAFTPLGADSTLEVHSDPARCVVLHDPTRRRIVAVFRGTADFADVKDDLHLSRVGVPVVEFVPDPNKDGESDASDALSPAPADEDFPGN